MTDVSGLARVILKTLFFQMDVVRPHFVRNCGYICSENLKFYDKNSVWLDTMLGEGRDKSQSSAPKAFLMRLCFLPLERATKFFTSRLLEVGFLLGKILAQSNYSLRSAVSGEFLKYLVLLINNCQSYSSKISDNPTFSSKASGPSWRSCSSSAIVLTSSQPAYPRLLTPMFW